MPVLAFDRHPDHNVAALDFVKSRPGTDVGIRLQMIDIESYNLTKEQPSGTLGRLGGRQATDSNSFD